MIVCHEHKFVFIEVPHTGSHSIAAELIENFSCERVLRKHANLSQYLGQATKQEKDYFKFATVRNPLDSAVTDFFRYAGNHKGQYTNPSKHIDMDGNVTDQHLEEFRFVFEEKATFSEFLLRYRAKIYHNWFLLGADQMDHVIRFENIQTGYRRALEKIGIDPPRDLPHANPTQSKKKHFSEYYDNKAIEIAVKYYGPFMKQWGYDFPSAWSDNTRVPALSHLRYKSVESVVGSLAKIITLDPDNKFVGAAKNVVSKFV